MAGLVKVGRKKGPWFYFCVAPFYLCLFTYPKVVLSIIILFAGISFCLAMVVKEMERKRLADQVQVPPNKGEKEKGEEESSFSDFVGLVYFYIFVVYAEAVLDVVIFFDGIWLHLVTAVKEMDRKSKPARRLVAQI